MFVTYQARYFYANLMHFERYRCFGNRYNLIGSAIINHYLSKMCTKLLTTHQ